MGCKNENENYSNSTRVVESSLELKYATEFSADYYTDGYVYIHIEDGLDYVLVPEGLEDDNLGFTDATLIHMPVDSIYLAATSSMDHFVTLDALDLITACSTTAEDYSIEEVSERIEDGSIAYVGKYSAPDYENLLGLNTGLAIESTMIYHSPKIKEQLEELGIPVLVERSSYEAHPLGRLEWIKLYGLLAGREDEAESFFSEQEEKLESVIDDEEKDNRPTVLFFHVSSNGYVTVRKPGDYVCTMIEMSGGQYALDNLEIDNDNALSTININWEDFYNYGVDADIIIYNSTITGPVNSIQELIDINSLFADFKAVREGNVWCTNKNMFQESSATADIIVDLDQVINYREKEDLKYLFYLR